MAMLTPQYMLINTQGPEVSRYQQSAVATAVTIVLAQACEIRSLSNHSVFDGV
jgi:hypothetical protein